MNKVKIINYTKKKDLIQNADCAVTFYQRAKGLLGRKTLQYGEALVLKRCNSIHTFFMKFPIDVVFIHKNGTVLKIMSNIKPGRLSPIIWKAAHVIEFPAGFVTHELICQGDIVQFIKK